MSAKKIDTLIEKVTGLETSIKALSDYVKKNNIVNILFKSREESKNNTSFHRNNGRNNRNGILNRNVIQLERIQYTNINILRYRRSTISNHNLRRSSYSYKVFPGSNLKRTNQKRSRNKTIARRGC